ncbi:hypothetical protein Skr01_51820 [Sphaerisporangium krabiense]|uniref:Putative Zn-dependent protease n=1 Tax=Sphaerisporangium krabiense TaxID=763782 RepID=A0A7W8ZA43_9ACTN|nr:metallopeptidase TldD-related protein [Sphaerisporangium krabiense]MBB5630146.1 putative Zn-dependent protease [Sphaerisporangium krabiense]GII65097.1 hypothetical protein Skr01_51820 [Sphaerisporangium krabiense]
MLLDRCRALLHAVAAAGGDAADVECVSTSVRAVQVFADGTHAARQGVTTTTGLRVRAGDGAAALLLGAPPEFPDDVARLAVALARRSRADSGLPLISLTPATNTPPNPDRDSSPRPTPNTDGAPRPTPDANNSPHATSDTDGTTQATSNTDGAPLLSVTGADGRSAMSRGTDVHPAPAEPEAPFEMSRGLLAELLATSDGPAGLGAEYVHSRSWTIAADWTGAAVAYEQSAHHAWHWLEGLGGHMVDGLTASRFDELRWDALAARAREFRAVHLAGPRPLGDEGPLPVLLHPGVAAHLVRSLGFLFSAGNVLAGMRPLLERVGRRIASPAVTLVDDPSGPVDAEGTPTRRQTLLDGGVLRGFLTGRTSAAELGVAPSGAARRAAPDQPAVESPSRISLAAGERSLDALRAEMGDGVEAVGVVQPGAIRGRRGTFTTVVLGWRVRDGRRAEALGPVRLSSGIFELLRSITATGNDPARSHLAPGAESPSVLISRMDTG